MERRYPARPMVGVGAVIFRGTSVLLVRRGREPARGKWSVPGGLVEVGEKLHEAVSREVLEEVGLHVHVKSLVAVLDRIIPDSHSIIEYHYILLDFLCECKDESPPVPATDALECTFVELDALPQYTLTTGTAEIIHRAFAQSKGAHLPVYLPDL